MTADCRTCTGAWTSAVTVMRDADVVLQDEADVVTELVAGAVLVGEEVIVAGFDAEELATDLLSPIVVFVVDELLVELVDELSLDVVLLLLLLLEEAIDLALTVRVSCVSSSLTSSYAAIEIMGDAGNGLMGFGSVKSRACTAVSFRGDDLKSDVDLRFSATFGLSAPLPLLDSS